MNESDRKHITSALQNIVAAILAARQQAANKTVEQIYVESSVEEVEAMELRSTWPGARTQVIYATWEATEREIPFSPMEIEA